MQARGARNVHVATKRKDKAFRAAYAKAYKAEPDVYAVQGYDAAQLLNTGLVAVKGLDVALAALVHNLAIEYLPFILMLLALFTVKGKV